MTTVIDDLSYPVGRFSAQPPSAEVRRRAVADIGALPGHLATAVLGLNEAQLDTPYRPGGWTVRQVVHHVADSHMNAFVRLKLALTEDRPTIAAYDEKKFATLADVRKWFGEDDPWVERPNPARGAFYAEVMAESPDGWRPVFDPDQMLRSRETWVFDAHWEELAQVRCPALVVRGLDGELGRAEDQEMVRVLPHGRYAEVADAGHLVHYDQPETWLAAIEPFLDSLDDR